VLDGGYDRPMGFHGGYEVGMGKGMIFCTLTHTHHSWVWVRNLFTQSKIVNIVIILNIIDTHTTTQDYPYPSLRVWVCMGMGKGRGKNTHGLPMSNTNLHTWLARSLVLNISSRFLALASEYMEFPSCESSEPKLFAEVLNFGRTIT
jgi:hypothetical protein